MLGGYLSKVFDAVSTDETEINNSSSVADSFVEKLKIILPEIERIRIFGSMTRRTNLSRAIDEESDIDAFLIISQQNYMQRLSNFKKEIENTNLSFDEYWLNELCDKIQNSSLIRLEDVQFDPPCLNVRYQSEKFQLTLASEIGEDSYLFFRRISKWEQDNKELLGRYMGAGALDADSDQALFHTNPFYLTELSQEFQKVWGDAWRLLIVILKYWKYVHQLPLTSYMIEDNVFNSLDNIDTFKDCTNLFDLLRTFLENDSLYDAELFNSIIEFGELKKACQEAVSLFEKKQFEDSLRTLADAIPPPDWLHLFPCRKSKLN